MLLDNYPIDELYFWGHDIHRPHETMFLRFMKISRYLKNKDATFYLVFKSIMIRRYEEFKDFGGAYEELESLSMNNHTKSMLLKSLLDIFTMERTYQYLEELTPNKEDSKIKVRVTREWESRNPNTNHLINKNYILMDEQGMLFHVLLMLNQIDEYTRRIQVGNLYLISTFAIACANDTYRPVKGDKVINFTRKTNIKKLGDDSSIPRHGFELATFDEARSRVGATTTLIDVVGKLKSFTRIQTLPRNKEKLDITLQDDTGDEMTVTLWGQQAHQFEDLKNEYQRPNIVLIVTGTKAVMYNAKPTLSATSATQYFINIDYPAVNILRKKGGQEKLVPVIIQPITNPRQLLLDNIDHISIETLLDIMLPDGKKEFYCSIEAKVIGIVPNYGWYYIGCNKCFTKMKVPPHCNSCTNKDTSPVKKYSVLLKVQDQTSTTTVLLFDRYVLDLVKVPVQHVLDNDESADPSNIPSILNNIIGGTFKFYLKITAYNTTGVRKEGYTVVKVEEMECEENQGDKPVKEKRPPSTSTKQINRAK
nr:PREDICTED: replication protein A 70 kDa DNA-binding subunit C-like [Daucus carota subsp. sativus]